MSNVVAFKKPEGEQLTLPPASSHAYAELAVTTNFSFLRGASHSQELVKQAVALGLDEMARRRRRQEGADDDGHDGEHPEIPFDEDVHAARCLRNRRAIRKCSGPFR